MKVLLAVIVLLGVVAALVALLAIGEAVEEHDRWYD
jgi:hypothetical protein